MYVVVRRPAPLGQLPAANPPWWRDVLVTTTAVVIGTLVVEHLRRRKVL